MLSKKTVKIVGAVLGALVLLFVSLGVSGAFSGPEASVTPDEVKSDTSMSKPFKELLVQDDVPAAIAAPVPVPDASAVPEEPKAPEPAPVAAVPAAVPPAVAAPAPPVAYYVNCSEVVAAGKAPIYKGDPGWSAKFDRDKDGIGCDK